MNTLIFFQKTRKLLFSSLLVACSLILNAQHVNVTLWVCNQIDSLETEAQQTSFINFLKVPYDSIDLNVCIKRIPCPSDLNCQEYTDGFCIYSDLNDPNALDILIVPGDLNPSCQKWNGMCVAGRAILGGDTSYAIYDPTATIARHELGHMLGLFHTYHGTQCLEDPNNEYPGDFVDDTPVSPDPEDVVYVNMQGGPIDWANTLDECMQNFNTQHDPGNVLQPNLMSQYNFQNKVTQGQITRMRTIISTTHVGKTTSVATPCPWASSVHVGDVNSVTSWSGGTELNGEIVITDTLNVEGNIHVGSSAKITVLERGVLNITNANFGSKCGESWSGIFVEEGGVITISNATIWNAETGLSLRGIVTHANGSGNGSSINGLTFNGCDVSLKINNCGDASYEPSSSVHLVNVTCNHDSIEPAQIRINNSAVRLRSSLISRATVKCSDSFLTTEGQTVFFEGAKINYLSGPRLIVDDTSFEGIKDNAIVVSQCRGLMVCRSIFFPEHYGGAIECGNVDKIDVFYNRFSGFKDDTIIHLKTGLYGVGPNSNESYIRDNIFIGGWYHIGLNSDSDNLNLRCNDHSEYTGAAWLINGELKTQGASNNPADNLFRNMDLIDFDIENNYSGSFDYYYKDGPVGIFNPLYPDIIKNVDLFDEQVSQDRCKPDSVAMVVDGWNEFYECYNNPDPTVICCVYTIPPPPTSDEDYECINCPSESEEGDDNGNNGGGINNGGRKAGHQKISEYLELELNVSNSNSNFKIFPNPVSDELFIEYENYEEFLTFRITNLLGQSILEGEYSERIDLKKLIQGQYLFYIINNKKQVVQIEKFTKI